MESVGSRSAHPTVSQRPLILCFYSVGEIPGSAMMNDFLLEPGHWGIMFEIQDTI